MLRPDQIGITNSLQQLIASVPNEQERNELIQVVIEGIVSYIKQYQEDISRGARKVDILKGFYTLMDEITSQFDEDTKSIITCKKGCAFCCHINVDIDKTEAQIIVEYCKENNISIDIEHLERQKNLTTETHMLSVHSKCVFLQQDNTCGIYAVRPLACRKYFAAQNPQLCNGKVYPTGISKAYVDADLEMIASAILSIDSEYANMPTKILEILKPESSQTINHFIDDDNLDLDDDSY